MIYKGIICLQKIRVGLKAKLELPYWQLKMHETCSRVNLHKNAQYPLCILPISPEKSPETIDRGEDRC